MKKYFRPYCLLLYLLTLLFFTALGTALAGLAGAGDGQGLAGGAIVLFNGLIIGLGAVIASMFLVKYANRRTILIINGVLALAMLVLYIILRMKYEAKHKEDDPPRKEQVEPNRPTAPAAPTEPVGTLLQTGFDSEGMGMGFFLPDLYSAGTLYFYGQPNFEKSISDHSAYDSLVFRQTESGLQSVYGPPWLFPEYSKLDYGIFYFKVNSIGHDILEVEGNKRDGRTTYVDRNAGRLLLWSEFILTVNSVEFPPDSDGRIFRKPQIDSDEISTRSEFMRPLRVKGDWLQVSLQDDNMKSIGIGWIRWRENGRLQVAYSLLS